MLILPNSSILVEKVSQLTPIPYLLDVLACDRVGRAATWSFFQKNKKLFSPSKHEGPSKFPNWKTDLWIFRSGKLANQTSDWRVEFPPLQAYSKQRLPPDRWMG
jgi:hypothetical protein